MIKFNFEILMNFKELEGKSIKCIEPYGYSENLLIYTTSEELLIVKSRVGYDNEVEMTVCSEKDIINEIRYDGDLRSKLSSIGAFDLLEYEEQLKKEKEQQEVISKERNKKEEIKTLIKLMEKYKDHL